MKYKYKARCSQCGLGFRSNFRNDLMKRLQKHLWLKHKTWMIKRIKAGLKKRKKANADNPHLQQALLAGIFPPGNIPDLVKQYKAMTPVERSAAKAIVKALTVPVGGGASPIADVALKILDRTVDQG